MNSVKHPLMNQKQITVTNVTVEEREEYTAQVKHFVNTHKKRERP
mgnify:FL=1